MEKIIKLRKLLINYNLDGYIVPKNDEFFGEYVHKSNDRLKYISNFSGSYGFALILKTKNFLFVDGRYTLQAKIQSGKLYDIITIPKKLPVNILKKRKLKIGYDPKLYTQKTLNNLFKKTKCILIPNRQNLIDLIKNKKIKDNSNKFYVLPKKVVGKDYKSKIKILFKILNNKKVDFQLVSACENVAWLLNIRGRDSEFSPIPNAYLAIDNKKLILFCDPKKIDKKFRNKFRDITLIDIKFVEHFLSKIANKNVLIDSSKCSIFFEKLLIKKNRITHNIDPIYDLKSIKTKIEIKNMEKSHILDGAALTKFLFWIKKNYIKKKVNEVSAQKKLLQFRKKNKEFKFPSFPTISGSGPNGAIIHYKATERSKRKLKKGDIYLVDSGGQYNFGTTDVTRTLSLNNNNVKIKQIFTRVLKGHIAVANYKLKSGTRGSQIDHAARKSLKQIGLNYPHGTGHGVGYFLNVHEGPQSFSRNNKTIFKEGMVISNEPGFYLNGKFGIRIENLICVKKFKKSHKFIDLTMAPIDKSLIVKKILKKNEINWLNNYHSKVFNNLNKFMNKSELDELKKACSKI